MASSPIVLTPGLLRVMRASGWTLLATLVVVGLDVVGLRLPQPLRGAVPYVLVVSLLVWLTLLSGTIGLPKRPAPMDADAPDTAAPGDTV